MVRILTLQIYWDFSYCNFKLTDEFFQILTVLPSCRLRRQGFRTWARLSVLPYYRPKRMVSLGSNKAARLRRPVTASRWHPAGRPRRSRGPLAAP